MKQPYTDILGVQEVVPKLRLYLHEIQDLSNIFALFTNGFYFPLDATFPHATFENSLSVHAYFVRDPNNSGLSLVFISEAQDAELASSVENSTPYVIYETTAIQSSVIPIPKDDLLVENPYEMANRWAQQKEGWLAEMHASPEGLTIVSDVPIRDVTEHFNQGGELQVFLGLRGASTPNPALKLSLLFYDPDPVNGGFLTQRTEDFSTPKPPFGKKKGKNKYGLLKVAESSID